MHAAPPTQQGLPAASIEAEDTTTATTALVFGEALNEGGSDAHTHHDKTVSHGAGRDAQAAAHRAVSHEEDSNCVHHDAGDAECFA